MKKLIILLSSLFCAVLAQAAVLLTEPFNYPDGSLISQEPGWSAHSGAGSGPQLTTNQSLRVVFANAEDTDVGVPGGPYGGGSGLVSSLYASMVVNFESLPGGTNTTIGNYFAHFWDSSSGADQTNGFRCRVFAYTNGATDGNLILGLTAVGGAVTNADYVTNAFQLTTNVSYTVVTRLDVNNGNSQLWINPNVETDASVSTSGPGTSVPIQRYCFRQVANLAGVVRISNLKVGTAFTDVAGTNTPPSVSGLPTVRADTSKNVPITIPFTVTDDHNAATTITTTATSSNVVTVPNANIVITNDPDGIHRYLTITPGSNREGNAGIKLVAKNPAGASNVVTFPLFIGAPSISAIPSQLATAGDPPTAVNFQVQDHESLASTLTVTASSSNPTLVPGGNMVLTSGSGGTNRTLTITPVSGQAGITTITLKCSDAFNTVTNTFTFDVAPALGLVFSDNFDSYADGTSLSQANNSPWLRFSGTLYQLIVSNQMAIINETNSEDIYAPLTGAPFTTSSGTVLYYGFKLNLAKLPSAAGDYFVLLNDTTTSGFKAKTFVASGQAAPGYYRVGIANGGSAPNVQFPQDLSLNSSYYVVVRYIVGSASTTLWINPVSESSPNVTALDGTPAQEIDQIAMRESSVGEGIEYIDSLVVSSSFSDVAPALIVNPIANRSTPISTSTGPIPFVVTDKAVSPDSCTYGGVSDNQSLVANANITFGGSGTNRTVTIVPTAGQQGFANITINVSDNAGNANTATFLLTVGSPATNGVVISQFYPGGGNAGATYNTKFVELFNRTATAVSLNNWSLQYASSNGTTWTVGNFANLTVAPYSYYLVALGAPGTNGAALPVNADFTLSGVNPSQAVGKLALCNSQGPLSGSNPLPNSTVADFVGYGSGTSAYEGTGPVAWTTANANSMFRASGGCVDTGNNAGDFTSAAVSPRNSATAQNICASAPPTMRAFISANNIVIAWPNTTVGFHLETATTVNQVSWATVGTTPSNTGSEYQVTLPISATAFYRLKQ